MSKNSIKKLRWGGRLLLFLYLKLRWGGRLLLFLYLACLIYFMFFSESYGRTDIHAEYRYNLVLFREISRFLRYRERLGFHAVLINVVGNVAVFIPFGFGLPLLFERFLRYRERLGFHAVLINVVGNVAVFIPFGFGLPLLFERIQGFLRIMILSFSTSLLAETLQLILRVGCFDVDDLLLNTIGGCIGYLAFLLFRRFWRERHGSKKL